jgi:electron transport complex protein RnfC
VVNGVDSDLLVTKNQFVVTTEAEALKQGIETLRKVSGIQKILLLVPDYLKEEAEKTGAEVRAIDPLYPDTLPRMVMKNLFGKTVPVGKKCEDLGIGFVSAEAVVALQKAFSEGQVPLNKLLTVIKKDGSTVQAKARIGTPVKDILKALQIETSRGDRVVLGGAMAGLALFSEEEPVESDTDAILVQDKAQIVSGSDSHCVNCGECVRVCPAKMPVNMLIRYLENGRFEEAQEYDLLSCIECGLCTYACIVRIPIFQYVMLGKQEIARIKSAEEAHA